MSEPTFPFDDERTLAKARQGLHLACAELPHLAGLAQAVRLQIDGRIETAGIFASGRILINPEFFGTLSLGESAFVMAHELFHLVLDSHHRGHGSDARLINIAHDFIINDMLTAQTSLPRPPGILLAPGARELSLERLVLYLKGRLDLPPPGWRYSHKPGEHETAMGKALREAGLVPAIPESSRDEDVLSDELEQEWFADETPHQQHEEIEHIQEQAAQASALDALFGRFPPAAAGPEGIPGHKSCTVEALHGSYRTSWESALQRWLDAVAPEPRTYARPSRRTGDRRDVVLPGRRREGWTLHIILDTSGSVWDELPTMLGAAAAACEAAGVGTVHVVQCDRAVTCEEWIGVEELVHYRVTGFAGLEGAHVPEAPAPTHEEEPPPPPPPPTHTPPAYVPPPSMPVDPAPYVPPAAPPQHRKRTQTDNNPPPRWTWASSMGHHKPARKKKRRKQGDKSGGLSKKGGDRPARKEPLKLTPLDLSGAFADTRRPRRLAPADSDLSPALLRLAADPEVEAVLVLTDGLTGYLAEAPPYHVLWVLPGQEYLQDFEPPYGAVIAVRPTYDA